MMAVGYQIQFNVATACPDDIAYAVTIAVANDDIFREDYYRYVTTATSFRNGPNSPKSGLSRHISFFDNIHNVSRSHYRL